MTDAMNSARERWKSATERHLSGPLVDGVTLRHVAGDVWHRVIDPLWAGQRRPGLDMRGLYTSEEAAAIAGLDAILNEQRMEHRVLFESNGEVVGGYWGTQDTEGRYGMVVSVFREDFRGRGLYTKLLPRVVDTARAAGFREIHSRHRADNNAIIVPKLKAGFLIAGVEIAPRWGLTVMLRKYLIDAVTLAHEYRVDGAHLDDLRKRGATT